MEGITVPFFIVAGMAIVGATIETFAPGTLSETVQINLKALTIAMIGILFSFLLLFSLLSFRIREGFEESQYEAKWNELVEANKVEDVCSLYTDIYEKILTVEKGAPGGETKTDAQAREATDARFASVMTQKPVSCSLFKELQETKGNLTSFFLVITKTPDSFFPQVYDTANGCLRLLIDQYNQVQSAEQRRVEGFQDLCTEEQAKERREFLKQTNPNEDFKKCLLPEEIPEDKKKSTVETKLSKLETSWNEYKKTIKTPISKILEDCAYYKGELDKKKKEAEDLSNKYDLKS
jgi:hypothetical protein